MKFNKNCLSSGVNLLGIGWVVVVGWTGYNIGGGYINFGSILPISGGTCTCLENEIIKESGTYWQEVDRDDLN